MRFLPAKTDAVLQRRGLLLNSNRRCYISVNSGDNSGICNQPDDRCGQQKQNKCGGIVE